MPVRTRSAAAHELQSKSAKRVDEQRQCSVCYTSIEDSCFETSDGTSRPRNGLMCPNRHTTCFDCTTEMCFPATALSHNHSRSVFGFKCPLCRSIFHLNNVELLTLIKRDTNKLAELFVCQHHMDDWARR